MFFGLCNLPATLQTMMNDILCPFINHNEAVCYMDDILIYSASLTDHQRITQEILQTLCSYKLFLRPEKCKFEHQEVDYLRLVISKDHVAVDPVKVQGVTDWPQPTKVKDVQSFIGFVNFYRRFIQNFSEITCPLHALTQKSKNWSWGAAEQQAFDALKNAVTSTPTLAFPSKSGLFQLECNASNFTTGAVLSQQQEDGLFHPIGFMLKSFSNTERNYQIHNKEMLVIMRTLEEWRHFLEGSDQKFEIHTDHKNLSYFQEAHKLNCCQAQWSLYLSRFDFVLAHKPGRQMGRPDALSRQADHLKGADDNTDCTLLTPEVFELRVMEAVMLEGEEATFMEWIRQSDQYDDLVVKALKALDVGELRSDEWMHTEGVVLYRGRVYVPDNPQLCHNLVHAHHSATVPRHPGQW